MIKSNEYTITRVWEQVNDVIPAKEKGEKPSIVPFEEPREREDSLNICMYENGVQLAIKTDDGEQAIFLDSKGLSVLKFILENVGE